LVIAMTNYPSDLTMKEYALLKPLLPELQAHPRRKWEWLVVLNAIFYVLRSGCAWRMMPGDHVPWQTAYHYFRIWSLDGSWERINEGLREQLRIVSDRDARATGAIMDSQSAKTGRQGGERGFDGHKKVSGRKRFLLTDTLGLLLKVKVLKANTSEGAGGILLLQAAAAEFPELRKLWVDQGFRGAFLTWVSEHLELDVEVTQGIGKPGDSEFKPAPRRWVIERTLAWLIGFRRLSRDFERFARTTEAIIYACMSRLMLARLAKLA
jgi:putative transposase